MIKRQKDTWRCTQNNEPHLINDTLFCVDIFKHSHHSECKKEENEFRIATDSAHLNN